MFTITIENLLRFHKYFDDKMISTKNFPLGFGKIQSTVLFYLVTSLHKCGKIWKRKDRANILRHLKSHHQRGQQVSSSFQISSFKIAQIDRV